MKESVRQSGLASVVDKFIEHQKTCSDCRDTTRLLDKRSYVTSVDKEPFDNLCKVGRYILLDLFI